MENGQYMYDTDLVRAINSGHEIMIRSDLIYVINCDWLNQVKYRVLGTGQNPETGVDEPF